MTVGHDPAPTVGEASAVSRPPSAPPPTINADRALVAQLNQWLGDVAAYRDGHRYGLCDCPDGWLDDPADQESFHAERHEALMDRKVALLDAIHANGPVR